MTVLLKYWGVKARCASLWSKAQTNHAIKSVLLIRECFLVMLLAPTTPILGKDIAQPWGGCLIRFEGAEAWWWVELQCVMFQKHEGQSCKNPTAKAARCFNKRRWSKQITCYHSCVGPQRHIRSNRHVCRLVQLVNSKSGVWVGAPWQGCAMW